MPLLPQSLNTLTGKMLVSAKPGSKRIRFFKLTTDASVAAYRASRGKVGGTWFGAPVMLLDHVGRKTGKHRTTPVLYLHDGPNVICVGSRAGSPKPPAWALNLMAHPDTTIQIKAQKRNVRARHATAEETDRLWPPLTEMYPDFTTYRARTDRELPIYVLEPR